MTDPIRLCTLSAVSTLLLAFSPPSLAQASDPKPDEPHATGPNIGLLDAVRDGKIDARAEGLDRGEMAVTLTNRTDKALKPSREESLRALAELLQHADLT